jgi:hypothetical protein
MTEIIHKWFFDFQRPSDVSGHNLAEENFTRETRDIENIFLREFDQNVLDARVKLPNGKIAMANIEIRIIDKDSGLNVEEFNKIFDPLENYLVAGGHPSKDRNFDNPKVLVLEEFNTVGLTGEVDNSRRHGEEERWTNFWFSEGNPSKSGNSLGRKGEGKITYHIISGARSVIAVTRREREDKDFLFGKCILMEKFEYKGEYYMNHGYWPLIRDNQPVPEEDPAKIKKIKDIFGLKRTTESGTSWIIPYLPQNYSEDILIREFVKDFFYSVLSENIKGTICGQRIDSSNVKEVLKSCGIEEPSDKFFDFMEAAITTPDTSYKIANDNWFNNKFKDSFNDSDLSEMKEKFFKNEVISVKAPIKLIKTNGEEFKSEIKIHIQGGIEKGNTEEAYIRGGLNIVNEKYLYKQTKTALGIMMADDIAISEFLGYCEEASHMSWKSNAKEAVKRYKSKNHVEETVKKVRHSLPMLHSLFSASVNKVLEDGFSDILGVPVPKVGKKARKKVTLPLPPPPPKPNKPKLFESLSESGNWTLSPGDDASKYPGLYPIRVNISLAYQRITGNPLRKYHPFDFNLSDNKFLPSVCSNIKVIKADLNKIILEVESPTFELKFEGFNTQIPIFSRVEYDD